MDHRSDDNYAPKAYNKNTKKSRKNAGSTTNSKSSQNPKDVQSKTTDAIPDIIPYEKQAFLELIRTMIQEQMHQLRNTKMTQQ